MSPIGRKSGTYLVLAVALGIFVASLATAGLRLVRIEHDIARGLGENLVWTVAQGEVELLRLLDALDRFEEADARVGREEVGRRFDLLWSRLSIMREGEIGDRLAAIGQSRETVDDAVRVLAELAPTIGVLSPSEASVTAVKERLRFLQPRLHEMAVWTLQAELERLTTRGEAHRAALSTALILLLGLLAGAVLLVVLLVREIRQTWELSLKARRAEAAAKRSGRRFQDVVEAASDWVWETGPDHRFTFISEQLMALSGEDPKDILGKTRWELRLPDDSDDENWARYRALVEARQPIRDFVFPHHDVAGRRHFSRVHGKPFFDAAGSFLGYRGTGRDITPELESAQEIADSRLLLRAVIDAVPAVINVKDRQSRYVLMNRFQGEVYGTDPQAAVDRTSTDLTGADYGGRSEEMDRQVIETGQGLPFAEREFIDHAGLRRFWWTAKMPLRDEAGAVRYVVTVALDITRLKEMERARNNLSRYFSPNMVEMLAGADEALRAVRSHDAGILFADIIGFSRLFAGETPEHAFALVREFHARMARIVFAFGGTLDKYIGDGLMASFGTPDPGPRDATQTLGCARSMAQEIAEWGAERAAAGALPVRIAIGAHYGPVLLGDIGDERRLEFAVIGETVNVASRLEGLTRSLRVPVVVSDALIKAAERESPGGTSDADAFIPVGPQTIRGLDSPVPVWIMEEPPSRADGLAVNAGS